MQQHEAEKLNKLNHNRNNGTVHPCHETWKFLHWAWRGDWGLDGGGGLVTQLFSFLGQGLDFDFVRNSESIADSG